MQPHGYFPGRMVDCDVEPCPTVLAGGLGAGYELVDDGRPPVKPDPTKPPYRVPTMQEIRATPWNGYAIASLFAGCGGSSTGYRMAGYRVALACDIVPEAREAYRANAADYTEVIGTDVRELKGAVLLDAAERVTGRRELDVLDGSPPCQSFSTAGKRDEGWGEVIAHGDGTTQRSDDLFFDFARIVDETQPRVFVAENVSGLVKGTAKGYFKRILAALREVGYTVEARLLDAQWLGVPQARQRLIFVGVRNDLAALGFGPVHPSPLPYRYSITDGCMGLGTPELEQIVQTYVYDKDNVVRDARTQPAQTILASGYAGASSAQYYVKDAAGDRRKFTLEELRRICSFPDDFVLPGSYNQGWTRLGNSVPPVMMRAVAETIRDRILDPAGIAQAAGRGEG